MNTQKITDALRDQAEAPRRLADAIETAPVHMPFVTTPAGVPTPYIAPPLTIPVTHPGSGTSIIGPWWGIVTPTPGIRVTC